MKLSADKLQGDVAKKVAPIYIISGDEPLLVQECCDDLRAALRNKGFTERDLYHVETGFDWQEVLFSANSMSLFAEQKLLELRIPNGKPGDKGAKAFASYCESIPDDTVLLVILPRIDKRDQNSKWFKTLEQNGVFVQIWPIELRDLPRWLSDRFRKVGLNADRPAVEALIDRVEGNLLAAVQEIERLRLIADTSEINADLVVEGVADSARYDVFGLIDAAVGQNPERTVKMVRGLRHEGVEPLAIVNLLARELRTLSKMALEVSQGKSIQGVIQAHRVWPKRKNAVGRCLQYQSLECLQNSLAALARADRDVKGIGQGGNPWDDLESALLNLAGKPVV